jgi:hypothetical protein
MRNYNTKITLSRNKRQIWDLDTFKGCEHGINGGCYGICYAVKLAKARGYNFSKVVKRDFINNKNFVEITRKLKRIPFVRIGVMCDPSFDWEHTLKIIERIKPYNKNIVIITKHWKELKEEQLYRLKGIVVNTSVSALDSEEQREKMLFWYNKLKPYCRSILRVNTSDFNDNNLRLIQEDLLNNNNVIDNVLRFPKSHILVKNKIINVTKHKFLNSFIYASKHKDNIFFGFCSNCLDQCGIPQFQNKLTKWLEIPMKIKHEMPLTL